MTAKSKASKEKPEDPYEGPTYYQPNVVYNKNTVVKVKDITSLSFGVAAGILRLSSWQGVGFFLATNLVTSIAYYAMIRDAKKYYTNWVSEIFVNDLGRFFASYVMMWCMLYALVNT